MLKKVPLTTEEVNLYGSGHINNYSNGSVGKAYNISGYGGMTYYNREDCGFVNGSFISTGCTNNWEDSDIKYVVDGWTLNNFSQEDFIVDSKGYTFRLITLDELKNNLGYGVSSNQVNENVPSWVYNSKYWYWTMPTNVSAQTWYVNKNGEYSNYHNKNVGYYNDGVVRPVVTLKKSALE